MNDAASRLRSQGFIVFPDILDLSLLQRLRGATERLLAAQDPQERKTYRYQGSDIHFNFQDPVLAELIAWPAALDALRQLGFDRPKFSMGTIISKPPGGPPLYWHQDWPYWDDPISAAPDAAQVFLMYYLTDTTPHNGCLRVIPRSHRMRVALHDKLPAAHGPETYHAAASHPMFQSDPDEIDVCVKAGDVVIGDARVLHAAHGNNSDRGRTVLTLWYIPAFDALPEAIKCAYARGLRPIPETVSPRERVLLEPLRPVYTGACEPSPWNRVPGKYLAASV